MAKNKGEWSELYIGLLCLKNGDIQLFNSSTKLKVKKIGYDLGHMVSKNDLKNFEDDILNLNQSIKENHGAFEISNDLINQVKFKKGKTSKKTDIFLNYILNSQELTDGFSIKSRTGSPPSILNASQATNLIFDLNGKNLEKYKTLEEPKNLVSTMVLDNVKISYLKCNNPTFENNLKMVDSNMDKILSEILILYYSKNESKLSKIIDDNFKGSQKNQYEARVKDFLFYVVSGMYPKKSWNGKTEIVGCVVLEKNRNLLALHTIDLNNFKEYIYKNVKLDTASTTRHKFGKIYSESGTSKLSLNLLIRFF